MTKDEFYMGKNLEEAKTAFAVGEIPIGAVIIYQKKAIARAYNLRESLPCATAPCRTAGHRKGLPRPGAGGDCRAVRFTLPANPALCVPEPSSTAAWTGSSTAALTPRPAPSVPCSSWPTVLSSITGQP